MPPLWLCRGRWAQGMSGGDMAELLGFGPWWHCHQRGRGSPQPIPPQIPARRATSPQESAPCLGWALGSCPLPWSSAPPPSPAAGVPQPQRALRKGAAPWPPACKHSRASSGRHPVAPVPWAVPPPTLRTFVGPGWAVHVSWLQEEQDPNALGCPPKVVSAPIGLLPTSPKPLAFSPPCPMAHYASPGVGSPGSL